MVRDHCLSRMKWPTGIVNDSFPVSDDVRSVKVKTAKGNYSRSVQRLHDLEIVSSKESLESDSESSDNSAFSTSTLQERDKDVISKINVPTLSPIPDIPVSVDQIVQEFSDDKDSIPNIGTLTRRGHAIHAPGIID